LALSIFALDQKRQVAVGAKGWGNKKRNYETEIACSMGCALFLVLSVDKERLELIAVIYVQVFEGKFLGVLEVFFVR
jgi:hypothetical protein